MYLKKIHIISTDDLMDYISNYSDRSIDVIWKCTLLVKFVYWTIYIYEILLAI